MVHTHGFHTDKIFHDQHGHLSIIQLPNLPLAGWLVSLIASQFVTDIFLKSSLRDLSTLFLFTWAFLEITQGQSYFRKALGGVIMVGILMGIFSN